MQKEVLSMATDGACNVKTKKGGWAFFDGTTIVSGAAVNTTNNQMEYTALLSLLKHIEKGKFFEDCDIIIHTDSELVARQLSGEYKVKQEHLLPLRNEACSLIARMPRISLRWVPRETPIMKAVDKAAKLAAGTA